MLPLTEQHIEKIIKVVADKSIRWAQAKSYGTVGNVPAGWTIKNEPGELVAITKTLFEENKQLKLKIEQLERIQNADT